MSFTQCLTDPINHDSDDNNAEAGDEAASDVESFDSAQDFEAQAGGSYHRGDDHHCQCHHNGLVDACHDAGAGEG